MKILVSLIIGASIFGISSAAALAKRSARPAIAEDFADPAILKVEDSWFAYGTGANGVNVQLATSTNDGQSWTRYGGVDAMPNVPGWVDRGGPWVWAPQVVMIVRISATSRKRHRS
jgi:hypothetical protein